MTHPPKTLDDWLDAVPVQYVLPLPGLNGLTGTEFLEHVKRCYRIYNPFLDLNPDSDRQREWAINNPPTVSAHSFEFPAA